MLLLGRRRDPGAIVVANVEVRITKTRRDLDISARESSIKGYKRSIVTLSSVPLKTNGMASA